MFELSIFLRDRLIGRSTFGLEEVRIGRSADNEVRIDNPALSRYHASIESVAGIHLLKDFGSQNGSFLNGERVAGRAALSDGDRIQLGKFTLVFRTEAKAQVSQADVRDHASYAVAGETMVLKTPVTARPCPWVGYLEPEEGPELVPPRHVVDRDLYLVGASPTAQLALDAASGAAARAALVVRCWAGFSLVALAAGVTLNGEPLELTAELNDGDRIGFGRARYAFHAGHPEG